MRTLVILFFVKVISPLFDLDFHPLLEKVKLNYAGVTVMKEEMHIIDKAPDYGPSTAVDDAAAAVARLAGCAPPGEPLAHETVDLGSGVARIVRRVGQGADGYWILAASTVAAVLAERLTAAAVPRVAEADLERLRLEARYPTAADIPPKTLPQELGRDARAISFTKGCYLGQETVARLDSLGHVNRRLMLLATMIAFLSCAAIVATGMTTAVLEELREMGIARAIGASRAQLFGAQLVTGLAIGLGGGVIGVPVGLALLSVLVAIYRDYVPAGLTFDMRGAAIAVAGAALSGVLGGLFPAFRAARISPLEALAIRARPPRRGLVLAAVAVSGAIFAVWAIGLVPESRDTRFWIYAFGTLPLLHVAWFLLSVPITLGVSRAASPLFERVLRLPPGLLSASIARMPWRLGCTAGALMVAVSILVSTRSNGDAIIRDLRERVRFADGFVFCTSGLSRDEQARIASTEGVAGALPIGYLPLRVAGEQLFGVKGMGPTNVVCVGFEPRPFLEMNRLDWLQGDPETAIPRLEQGDAILVAPEFLVARGLGVGSKLRLGSGKNEADFEIVGVVTAAGLDIATQTFGMRQIYMEQAVSCVFMSFDAVERHFDTRDAYIMQLKLAPGLDEDAEKRLGEQISDRVPGAVFSSGRAIRGFVEDVGRTGLALTSAVALAALALAAIGVGSVVAAGISARTREFGILRAVGGSTRVLVGLVLGETLVMALAALVSGTALGLQLAWMGVGLYRDFAGLRLKWTFPYASLAVGAIVVVAVALLAATPAVIRLARRPARALLASA